MTDDERPGLPGLRSWPTVYVAVGVAFAACVLGLTVLSHAYP